MDRRIDWDWELTFPMKKRTPGINNYGFSVKIPGGPPPNPARNPTVHHVFFWGLWLMNMSHGQTMGPYWKSELLSYAAIPRGIDGHPI